MPKLQLGYLNGWFVEGQGAGFYYGDQKVKGLDEAEKLSTTKRNEL